MHPHSSLLSALVVFLSLSQHSRALPAPSPSLLALRTTDLNADKPRAIIFFATSPTTSVTKTVIIGTTQNPAILNPISAEILEVQGETSGQEKVACEASENNSSDAAGRFEGMPTGKGKAVQFGKDVRIVSRVFCDFV
ncbi:hypothetical protein BU16DRAFT_561320 [Lophium mytilinum]|uniref:Pectate lyase n=1 Tax=Lophium mytilinum TaxID=390894 RepID=A0A6A6QWM7_9PEZI|nr:hypothetical protein BU16DRAFT_561320 [Lophium mytilinum]